MGVVGNVSPPVSTEAIRRRAILFPSKACYTCDYGLHIQSLDNGWFVIMLGDESPKYLDR